MKISKFIGYFLATAVLFGSAVVFIALAAISVDDSWLDVSMHLFFALVFGLAAGFVAHLAIHDYLRSRGQK